MSARRLKRAFVSKSSFVSSESGFLRGGVLVDVCRWKRAFVSESRGCLSSWLSPRRLERGFVREYRVVSSESGFLRGGVLVDVCRWKRAFVSESRGCLPVFFVVESS